PLEELDVVEQEHVDRAVTLLEVVDPFATDALDEVVEEILRGHVADGKVWVQLARVVADGIEEVGLAQAGRAVDEERVVADAGSLGDRHGGGVGEAVRGADDE